MYRERVKPNDDKCNYIFKLRYVPETEKEREREREKEIITVPFPSFFWSGLKLATRESVY